MPAQIVESAARTLLLLEELNKCRVATLQMLHSTTKLPKATIVRLLKTLCAMGYATNDRRQGGYSVASRVKSLSYGFHGDPLVIEAARPWALGFTREHHWPLAVALLDGDSMMVRFSTIPDSPLAPLHSTINKRLSLLGRAVGLAYLAYCPDGERSILLDLLKDSRDKENAIISNPRTVEVLLARVRKQGYAEREQKGGPGSSSTLAVPILIDGQLLATVGMTFYTGAVNRTKRLQIFIPALQILASNIAGSVRRLSGS